MMYPSYNLVIFIVALAVACFVCVGFWSARSRMRVIRERYAKLYAKIPASTFVTLTTEERKFYRFLGVGVIVVWFFGVAGFLIPRSFAWKYIPETILVTVLAWLLAIRQFRLARSKQTRFDRLSMIDKTQRARKVK